MAIILVTGSNGQLGSELKKVASSLPGHQFLFTTREELSIADNVSIENYFSKHKITHCINCAAYTAVDLAETDRENAMLINADAVGHLATACQRIGAMLIHISTDYVFDGKANELYQESNEISPVNYYGSTKLAGEKAAITNNPTSIVIRTSWLYSSYGKNFVKTMLRLMKEKETLNVVNDQFGSPTYAADLAAAIVKIVENPSAPQLAGIYQYSNSGVISWFDFATAIREFSGLNCTVLPIPTSSFPTPASRPQFSAMDTNKIREKFSVQIVPWQESLSACLKLLV